MLRLVRRPLAEFLDGHHQSALTTRTGAASQLARRTDLSDTEKSARMRQRWDDFRRGKTSTGTFPRLWAELSAMGFDKCAFCETPAPGTVEHLDPLASAPTRAFVWDNLLAACDACNRTRENSGVRTRPFDPSADEVLDHLGWDEYGDVTPHPVHRDMVDDLVRMYGLHRFRRERGRALTTLRALLCALIAEDAERPETIKALRLHLDPRSAWLGPLREFFVRPASEDDALLAQGALLLLPDLRGWVAPWLRPPPWAPSWWQPEDHRARLQNSS